MRTRVVGRTYDSQTGHLPSHVSHSRPSEMPDCLRHMTRSGWWRDIATQGERSGREVPETVDLLEMEINELAGDVGRLAGGLLRQRGRARDCDNGDERKSD